MNPARVPYGWLQRSRAIEPESPLGPTPMTPNPFVTAMTLPMAAHNIARKSRLPAVFIVLGTALLAVVAFEWWFWSRPTGNAAALVRPNRAIDSNASLVERYRRDGLSPALVDQLLDLQGNPGRTFSHDWDVLLTAAYTSAGKMTEPQRRRFVRQTLTTPLTLTAKPSVRAGQPLVVTASWSARGCMDAWLRYEMFPVIDGRSVLAPGSGGTESFNNGQLTMELGPCLTSDGPLAVGVHHLHVTLRRQPFDWHSQPRAPPLDVTADLEITVVADNHW